MFKWFLELEQAMYYKYGYDFVIHFEDLILFTAGVFLGMLIMSICAGDVLSKIRKVRQKRLDKLKIIDVESGKKTEYILNAQSVAEFIETFLIILLKPICTIKRYTLKDERRTKIFICILIIVGIFISILAYISINTVFLPPQ